MRRRSAHEAKTVAAAPSGTAMLTQVIATSGVIRRNILQDERVAARYVEGVLALKDPARFPRPAAAGLSIYDFFVFWHARSMMTLTPPTQSDRNAAHSGPARACAFVDHAITSVWTNRLQNSS